MDIPALLLVAFADRVSLPLPRTAELLGMDTKTLRGHVDAGNIRFVVKGLGAVRQRREFTLADILEFLERMRRRQCPSIAVATRRTTTSISDTRVVGFMARRAKAIAEKQKLPSGPKRSA